MAGIVTTSSVGGDGSRTWKMVFTSTSTSLAINWISGTSSEGVTTDPLDKGCELTIQNISTASVPIWVGPSTVAVQNGIYLAQYGSYSIGKRHAPSAIQMATQWVATTSSVATVVAHLIHAV